MLEHYEILSSIEPGSHCRVMQACQKQTRDALNFKNLTLGDCLFLYFLRALLSPNAKHNITCLRFFKTGRGG